MDVEDCDVDVLSDWVDEALGEAWWGAPERFDALLDDGEEESVAVCALLVEVREEIERRCMASVTMTAYWMSADGAWFGDQVRSTQDKVAR